MRTRGQSDVNNGVARTQRSQRRRRRGVRQPCRGGATRRPCGSSSLRRLRGRHRCVAHLDRRRSGGCPAAPPEFPRGQRARHVGRRPRDPRLMLAGLPACTCADAVERRPPRCWRQSRWRRRRGPLPLSWTGKWPTGRACRDWEPTCLVTAASVTTRGHSLRRSRPGTPAICTFASDIKNIAFCGDGVMIPERLANSGIPCNPSPGCTACQCDPA